MAKKKHSQNKQSFNKIVAELKIPKDIKENITVSSEEIESQITSIQNYNEQNLALSFKYLTENKEYNFQAFKKDKTRYEAFTTRLNNVLKLISNYKVKHLYNDPFKDKFSFSKLYPGTYQNSNKQFTGTEQIISVEFSSKKNERIILYHEDKEEDGRNILYVLGFDFNHNMYLH
ncbi:MAG: hypothetical protein E7354_03220 [Clostridiales bacterium]|nr:hypothetical protein [Clostridiales bacterium]